MLNSQRLLGGELPGLPVTFFTLPAKSKTPQKGSISGFLAAFLVNFAAGEEGAGKVPQGTGVSWCILEQLTCRGVAQRSFLISCLTEHYYISGLRH